MHWSDKLLNFNYLATQSRFLKFERINRRVDAQRKAEEDARAAKQKQLEVEAAEENRKAEQKRIEAEKAEADKRAAADAE